MRDRSFAKTNHKTSTNRHANPVPNIPHGQTNRNSLASIIEKPHSPTADNATNFIQYANGTPSQNDVYVQRQLSVSHQPRSHPPPARSALSSHLPQSFQINRNSGFLPASSLRLNPQVPTTAPNTTSKPLSFQKLVHVPVTTEGTSQPTTVYNHAQRGFRPGTSIATNNHINSSLSALRQPH